MEDDFIDSDPRRSNNLTNNDIARIIEAVNSTKHTACRFEGITSEDLTEAVKFYKNFNTAIEESKKTIRTTLLVLLIGVLFSAVGIGVVYKVNKLGGN